MSCRLRIDGAGRDNGGQDMVDGAWAGLVDVVEGGGGFFLCLGGILAL